LRTFLVNAEDWLGGGDGGGEGRGHQLQALVAAQNHRHLGEKNNFQSCCSVQNICSSKIKLNNANKKRTVTVRRVILFLIFKASIADLITLQYCLHFSVQNSEGGGDGVLSLNSSTTTQPDHFHKSFLPGKTVPVQLNLVSFPSFKVR
jgi:hypothetical protein